MKRVWRAAATAFSLLALTVWPIAASAADSVADFYRGKVVTLLVPTAAGGGGYDAYGRLVGRYIAEHIPGNPTIVVQNMPGANGITQANYLFNIAPKDGSTIAIIQHSTIFYPVLDPREVRYKTEGFRWLGSVAPVTLIGVLHKDAPVKTVPELLAQEVVIGGTGAGGTTVYLPRAINGVLHTKMKLVTGYGSVNEVFLAMSRKEVMGIVGTAPDALQSTQAGGSLDNFNILFQLGTVRDQRLPDVPLIQEFAKSDEDRAVLETICSSCTIGWVFATPAIADDRYRALRSAFEATVKSPPFVEQAGKQFLNVRPKSPEEIQKIVDRVYGLPETILKRAGALMRGE